MILLAQIIRIHSRKLIYFNIAKIINSRLVKKKNFFVSLPKKENDVFPLLYAINNI